MLTILEIRLLLALDAAGGEQLEGAAAVRFRAALAA
jgi:hypothetical protein